MEREALGPTNLGDDIVIPHARVEGCDDLIVGAVSLEPPLDGKIKLVLVFVGSTATHQLYLRVLAAFAQFFKDEIRKTALFSANTPKDFIKIVANAGIVVKRFLMIEDIHDE